MIINADLVHTTTKVGLSPSHTAQDNDTITIQKISLAIKYILAVRHTATYCSSVTANMNLGDQFFLVSLSCAV